MPKLTVNLVLEIMDKVLPDGATRSWKELLASAREFGYEKQVASLAFGAPESVSREGLSFTARAAAPATMTRWGIVVNSKNVVTFALERVGNRQDELKVVNITGVRVKPPIAPEFELKWANVRVDQQGYFVVSTRYYFLPVSARISPEGKISFF
jgi:hypothetical protein